MPNNTTIELLELCKVCNQSRPASHMRWDRELDGPICAECKPHVTEAEDVLFQCRIPPVARGPYCGNSNG